MKAVIYTRPTVEPVSVAEVKTHLRIDGTDDDELIATLVMAAREQVETITRRAIMTQTWDYFLDEFPRSNVIVIPFGNLASVTSVKRKDTAGAETTMTVTTDYLVQTNGSQHGMIVLPYGVPWPSGAFYPSNPITIRFICGWTSAALVPSKIRTAVKFLCAEMYENRGESVIGQTVVENKTVDALLASERLWGSF